MCMNNNLDFRKLKDYQFEAGGEEDMIEKIKEEIGKFEEGEDE